MKMFTIDPHRDCWELLPWVANERLPSSEAARIQSHLETCESCQAELAAQRRLRDIMRSDEQVVLAPQASFQRLMQRIEGIAQEDQDAKANVAGNQASTRGPFSRVPRWFAIAASVQAAAIALLLGLLWTQSQQRMTEPRFSTLTSPATMPTGPVIRVVFREQITMKDLNEILRSLDARIVAGPNTAGVFTLQLAAGQRTKTEVEAIAAQLRTDDRVLFSEPAIAEITGK
jgi:hypothetical protein